MHNIIDHSITHPMMLTFAVVLLWYGFKVKKPKWLPPGWPVAFNRLRKLGLFS